jgi:hypothetical protein
MSRKTALIGIIIACGILSTRKGWTDPTVSEINIMIIIDATGSMMVPFCEDEDGIPQDRFWCAKEEAKAFIKPAIMSNFYYSLYVLAGDMSGIIDLNDDDQNPRYFTNDRDEIIAAIDDVFPTALSTPLADVVCDSLSYLQAKADDESDQSHLHIYTDGGENQSFPENCGDYDDSHFNTFNFVLDAKDAYEGRDVVTNKDRKSWGIDEGSRITHEGRAYKAGNGSDYDWSGGVLPGSWEWRLYYRIAWGDPRSVGEENNLEWGPPVAEGDVVMNITTFVEEAFPEDVTSNNMVTMASIYKPQVIGSTETPTYYSLTPKTTNIMPVTNLPPKEDALFAGLAKLTRGRYTRRIKGTNAPILGDVNKDGEVNETDLRAVYTWFARPVDYYNQGSIDADITLGGFVDNADMMYVRYNWTDKNKRAPIMGDIDYNWCVDRSDLNQVLQWYGQSVNPNVQHSYHADINADGVIDRKDVWIVRSHMYEGCLNH